MDAVIPFPARPPTGRASALRVSLLGRFEVSRGGVPVPRDAWRRRRAADVLTLLALAPGHEIPREEILHTLLEAVVLVVLIVYLFLQSFRTTIICTVAIIVSLVTTFAGMLALGFSINLITLFAFGFVLVSHHWRRRHIWWHASAEATGNLWSWLRYALLVATLALPPLFLVGTLVALHIQTALSLVLNLFIATSLGAFTVTLFDYRSREIERMWASIKQQFV